MKKIIFLFFGLLIINFSNGQTWSALGSGMDIPFLLGSVDALAEYKSEIYAGGRFGLAGGHPAKNIAKWDGVDWSPLDSGVIGDVASLITYNNELYVGGNFQFAGQTSVNRIAKWNGLTWADVGNGIKGNSHLVNAMAVFNGELYVGGWFDSAGSISAHNIAKWDGNNWSSIGSGVYPVLDLCVYNNELYACGQFYLSKWDGSSWIDIDVGTSMNFNDAIAAIAVYNNDLYVAGRFDSIGTIGANSIAKWNGTNWFSLSTGTDHIDQQDVGLSLGVYNNELYMGGFFSQAGGNTVNNIAKWDGANWSNLGNGLDASVSKLLPYNGNLYVGGRFGFADGIAVNSIAKWNLPIGINEPSGNFFLDIFPNPSLDYFFVRNQKNMSFTLNDFTFKTLLRGFITNDLFKISMTGYSQGSYFITISNDGHQINQRIIKN